MNHPVNENDDGFLCCALYSSLRILFFPFTNLLWDSATAELMRYSATAELMCCYKSCSICTSYSGKCNSK